MISSRKRPECMASHNTNKYAVPRIALIFFLVLTFFTFEKTFAQHSASRKDRSYTVFTETSLFWNSVAWNPDGQKLILSIVGKDNPEIWDIKSGEKIGVLRGFTQAVGWSPDGKTIATQTEDYGCTGCHSIAFWDLSGTLLKILPSGDISVIKWSPDSRRVATNDLDAKVTIWNVTAGTHNLVFDDGLAPGVLGAQSSISWSPDGKYLAATSNHGHVLVWSSNPIKLIKDFS